MREKYYLDNDWYFSEKWEAAQSNAEYEERVGRKSSAADL